MEFENYLNEDRTIGLHENDTLVSAIESSVAAASSPEDSGHLVYRFLDYSKSRDAVVRDLTWAEFGRRLRAVAARLQQVTQPGDRVAILAPQGLDYLVAFFAAIYAGTIAVPLFDPNEPGHEDRLHSVLSDCEPKVILTGSVSATGVRQFVRAFPAKERPRIVAVDAVPDAVGEEWVVPTISLDTIAYLQYTSGSTRTPAGVQITHRNVMTNALQMFLSLGLSKMSRGVTWLPLFHDMGLLTVILPAVGGAFITLMSPQAFIQRPGRWINALAQTRDGAGTFAAAPNFAFELAARRGLPNPGEGLDLSNVVGLINGSEPVTPTSMRLFNEAFSPYGLSSSAIKPSYGMAEATLFVSTPRPFEEATVIAVDRDALAEGRIVKVFPGANGELPDNAVAQVGCGIVASGEYAVIVKPDNSEDGDSEGTGVEIEDGLVGEIWLHGDNIGDGYWGKTIESVETFGNVLRKPLEKGSHTVREMGSTSKDTRWLRTGDYGVYIDGELYITGRVKDLIIVDGRNHYPQDLEFTAQQASTSLRPGFIAAFSVPANELKISDDNPYGRTVDADDTSEQLVVVAERAPGAGKAAVEPIVEAVRTALSVRHGVMVRDVVLTPAGAIPRTSSGKIAHRATREAYLDGTLRRGKRQQAFPDAVGE